MGEGCGLDEATKALQAILDNAGITMPLPMQSQDEGSLRCSSDCNLETYQQQLLQNFTKSTANEVMFLPTGFGVSQVVDAIIKRTLASQPDKHVVVVVVRPSQALSHAARLSATLEAPVGV